MYKTIDEFLSDWAGETQSTIKVLKALSDESLATEVKPNDRTLGSIAWHVATAISGATKQVGLEANSPAEGYGYTPTSAAEILEEYTKESALMVKSINEKWTDASLDEVFNVWGRNQKGRDFLNWLLRHEIHHRSQMTILMSQAGLAVPGTYGPSKSDREGK